MIDKSKKVAMIVFSYFPLDVRVRREAEALADSGISVDIICLNYGIEPSYEIINGIYVHRFNLTQKRAGKLRYFCEYSVFIIWSSLILLRLFMKKRFDMIHVHNMPDILVLSAIIPKLLGAKVLLDLHDPTPELYMTIYSLDSKSKFIKMLRLLEKVSIAIADKVITPNIAFRDVFSFRSCSKPKINIVMNSPDEKIFLNSLLSENNNKLKNKEKFVLMFHGSIFERNGLDVAVEAVRIVKEKISSLEFKIYGDGNFLNQIKKKVDDYDLGDIVQFHKFVIIDKIAAIIPTVNLGIIPSKMTPFTNINFPTRIFEYLHMKKPVVVPRTHGIKDYFDEESIFYFDAGNVENLAEVIFNIYSDPDKTSEVVNKGFEIYKKYRWENQSKDLINIYDDLLN